MAARLSSDLESKPKAPTKVRDNIFGQWAQGIRREAIANLAHELRSPLQVLLGYLDDAGVDRAFLVQHHMYGNQNETVLECVNTWPDRFAGYAYLGPMDQPDAPDAGADAARMDR